MMKMRLLAACMLTGLTQGFALAQEQRATATSASILEERLRDAQVTRRTLDNRASFSEVKFAGSLQPNVELGCVSIKEVGIYPVTTSNSGTTI